MNVLYYYYYLFYTRVLPDNEPHATVIFTLSFSESLLINGIIDISSAHFCKNMEMWLMIGIFVMLIAANYLIYSKTKKSRIIVEQKPAFFSSHKVSIIITLLWFIITTSFMFWEPIYVKDILDQCR
jgi:hypothetical protein